MKLQMKLEISLKIEYNVDSMNAHIAHCRSSIMRFITKFAWVVARDDYFMSHVIAHNFPLTWRIISSSVKFHARIDVTLKFC